MPLELRTARIANGDEVFDQLSADVDSKPRSSANSYLMLT